MWVSLAILTAVVLLALTGLAVDGNWPKLERVSASFIAYVGTFLVARRFDDSSRDIPKFWVFAVAGCIAGIVSGLVRDEIRAPGLIVGAIAAALLLGGLHWLALGFWRRLRSALTS